MEEAATITLRVIDLSSMEGLGLGNMVETVSSRANPTMMTDQWPARDFGKSAKSLSLEITD
jgi:hypothetical protein